MNWKTWAPVAVAVVLGIICVKVGKDMISRNSSGKSSMTTAKVVILTADVPVGSAIKESDVTVGSVAAGAVPTGTFTDPKEVVGRIPQVALVRGQTVMENLLDPVGTMPGLPSLIPDGMRAVTIDVDEIRGVAGMLQPGCHIDLVSTIGGDNGGVSTARSIVENLTVLAVGRRYSNAPQSDSDPNQQGTSRAITLLADPHQVDLIELATHMSNPRLVLRGSRDFNKANAPGVTVAELRGKRGGSYDTQLTHMVSATSTTNPATNPSALPQEPTVYDIELIRNGMPTHIKMPLFNPPVVTSTVVQNVQPATPPTAEAVVPATQPTVENIVPATQPTAQNAVPATQPSGSLIRDVRVDPDNAIPNGKN